jgi:hypothetical protein
VGTTQVVGLSCDGLDDSWAVLDLTDLSITGVTTTAG